MNMLTHQGYSMRLIELFMDDCVNKLIEGKNGFGLPATIMYLEESDMKWIDRMVQVEDKHNLYFLNHWHYAQCYVKLIWSGEFILHERQTNNGNYYYELERIWK